jgi:hypothetical protein
MQHAQMFKKQIAESGKTKKLPPWGESDCSHGSTQIELIHSPSHYTDNGVFRSPYYEQPQFRVKLPGGFRPCLVQRLSASGLCSLGQG